MTRYQKLILIGCLGLLFHLPVRGQYQRNIDIQDWLAQKKVWRTRKSTTGFLFALPVVGANPAAGFIYGLGLTYANTPKNSRSRLSNLSSNASYSTKGLANLNLKSNLFVMDDRLFLNGDWRLMVISETTYGLGTRLPSPAEPLRYGLSRFHETGSWRLVPNFFAGLGIHFDRQFRIDDDSLDTGVGSRSYHYRYSLSHHFDPVAYTTAGVSLNLLFDNRDNPIQTFKGYYFNVNYRINTTGLGSAQNSTLLLVDCRAFFPLDGDAGRHVIGFWGYANYVTSGNVPYLMLPAIGYDQRQKTGRGYAFGRFRGEHLLYGESEYRYPISRHSGILGGVIFINVVSTSDLGNHVPVLEYLQPAYGAGLRLLLDKASRTRLQLDCAVGDNTPAFYFGIRETF